MIHERIVVVGSTRKHNRIGARLASGIESGGAPLDKLALEALLGIICHANCLARHIFVDAECLAQIRTQLAIANRSLKTNGTAACRTARSTCAPGRRCS